MDKNFLPSYLLILKKLIEAICQTEPSAIPLKKSDDNYTNKNNSAVTVLNIMSFYDEIEIEDMTWDEGKQIYHYPCPCGDQFEICLVS